MKWFWMMVAVLVVATVVVFARRSDRISVGLAPTQPIERTSGAPTSEASALPLEIAKSPATPAITPVVAAPDSAATSSTLPLAEVSVVKTSADESEAALAPTGSEIGFSLDELLNMKAEPVAPPTVVAPPPVVQETPKPVIAPEAPSGGSLAGASGSDKASDEAKPAMFRDQFEVVPARTKPGENGFTVYDERFPVKGAGTPEEPMEVSWDLLVSASETFQPRMGKKRLPERITMLDGKHVRVTGYVAFPLMAASQNELLSMRNMWDGCCIGVPPTPYDAIEVKLKAAATGRDRFTAFGVIEGKMTVDPYIKGNWLLGLYLMESAALSQLKEGGDPGKHGGM